MRSAADFHRDQHQPRINPDNAPVGTVCIIGHPANGSSATKQSDGTWTHNLTPHQAIDFDTIYKAMTAVYIPGRDL